MRAIEQACMHALLWAAMTDAIWAALVAVYGSVLLGSPGSANCKHFLLTFQIPYNLNDMYTVEFQNNFHFLLDLPKKTLRLCQTSWT